MSFSLESPEEIFERIDVRDSSFIKSIARVYFSDEKGFIYSIDHYHRIMKDVARTFHYSPYELSLLYLDRVDIHGLLEWYDDALDKDKEIKAATNRIKTPSN